ncbi:MAG TPA: MBL fold metallo-hydrolase [Sphingomicrobium sp.]|jgi:glyoxylase-like metal-dependent hydrolase (beta-lactamase superfamily II)|nr:MBL fold metallo-hydrolase [Sphingomicrobium sp.]
MRTVKALAIIAVSLSTAAAGSEPYLVIPGTFEEGRQPDGNSILLDAPKGLIVIDTGRHKAQQDKILDAAKARAKPIVAIINSHWHLDHTGGNQEIRAAYPKARIISSNAVLGALSGFLKDSRKSAEDYLAHEKVPSRVESEIRADFAAMDDRADLVPTDPVMKSGRRNIAGRPLDVHLARYAATEGDVWVYDPKTKTVFSGDLVTAFVPFLDTACTEGWKRALDEIDAVPFKSLVPGHGEVMDRAGFHQWRAAFTHFVDCRAGKEECIAGWKRDAAVFLKPLGNQNIDGLLGYYLDARLRGPDRDKYCPSVKPS